MHGGVNNDPITSIRDARLAETFISIDYSSLIECIIPEIEPFRGLPVLYHVWLRHGLAKADKK